MSLWPPRLPGRRLLIALAAAALVVVGLGVAALLYLSQRVGDVSNPDVPFVDEQDQSPKQKPGPGFVWPTYGYTKDRRRHLDASVRPPYRRLWTFNNRSLLEFPPVIAHRRLFLLSDTAVVYAIGRDNGRVAWKRKVGSLAAASPTVDAERVYVTVLQRTRRIKAGRVVALTARRGHVLWSRPLRSRTESSPLVDRGTLYFGTENGTVYALRARDGRIRWTYRAAGAVKGGPALRKGILYFGDYGGRVHAVRASNGRRVWSTGTKGARFGLAAGHFYSSPAVAFGRVYLGNTDGRMYSFAAQSGKLAWAKRTGDYIYGSPAVADIPHFGPAVYVGSYDGGFYALDARSGKVRWQRSMGGKISGAATVVGDVVYFANLQRRSTSGLAVRSGRRVFGFDHGGFNPVVSDGRRIYLVGYTSLYGLEPKKKAGRGGKRAKKKAGRGGKRARKKTKKKKKKAKKP